MPLDDNEQQILAEIERQFYEEDPDLAHAVRNVDRSGRFGIRLPAMGVVIGIVLVLVTFTTARLPAVAGFVLMVVSATALVHGVQARTYRKPGRTEGQSDDPGSWRSVFRRR